VKNLILYKLTFHGFNYSILLLVLFGASAAGVAILVIPSSFAPLFIVGLLAAGVFLYISFFKPVIALYAALFFSLIPSGMIQPEYYHSWINRGLVVLAFAAWIFGVITRKEKIRFLPTSILTLLFLVWAFITLIWVNDFSVGLQQLQVYSLRFIIFLLLIPNEIRTRSRLNGFMGVIALDGLALVIASLWILLTQGYTPGVRFTIFNVNENIVGVAAMITLAGVLWQAAHPRKHYRVWNTLAGIYFLFAIGITAISGSRGSTISLMVTTAAFLLWKSTRKWAYIALVFLVIAVVMYPAMFTTMVERFLMTHGDTLLNGREFTWQAAWMVIESNPIFGVGIGESRFAIIPYLSHIFSDQLSGAAVHNPVLTIWVETGLIGLFIYLSIPVVAVRSFISQMHTAMKEKEEWWLPYFAIISSIALGYLISWYVGGGLQSDFSYFLILSFLILPACIEKTEPQPVRYQESNL
jgi:putative inorganic carbon (hco3(-)) transporter